MAELPIEEEGQSGGGPYTPVKPAPSKVTRLAIISLAVVVLIIAVLILTA